MVHEIIHNDVEMWPQEYDGAPFHAMLCDPPYELGFMGKKWDATGIAFRPETWANLGKHLLPGAFGFAFASSRGWHRMAVAIEDAGFIIHPTIFLYTFGTGFPKATRIDTQVDKAAGVDVARGVAHPAFAPRHAGYRADEFQDNGNTDGAKHVAQSNAAQTWQGHRYGGQALKPATEPVICFQKPYAGKPIDCITGSGAGAFNIDGARIGSESTACNHAAEMGYGGGNLSENYSTGSDSGRWPANFAIIHHPDCREQCVPDCPVVKLDAQSGDRPGCKSPSSAACGSIYRHGQGDYNKQGPIYPDTGGASRFFHCATWNHEVEEILMDAEPVSYEAKASRTERNWGAQSQPEKEWIDGAAVPNRAIRPNRANANSHPTVKPIDLCKWLATLLLPPAAYAPRRIMVPFAGSGSECIGAMLAGWDEVVGIEQDEAHCNVARARLNQWSGTIQASIFDQ